MKRQHTYEKMIGQKLDRLSTPDVTGLWNQMESILDREMPQQEKKKRLGAWWLNPNLLMAASLALAIGGVYTFNSPTATSHTAKTGKNTSPNKQAITTSVAASGNGTKPQPAAGKTSSGGQKEKAVPSATVVAGHRSDSSKQNRNVAGSTGTNLPTTVEKKNAAASNNNAADSNGKTTNTDRQNTPVKQDAILSPAGTKQTPAPAVEAEETNSPAVAGKKGALAVVEPDAAKLAAPALFNGQTAKPLALADLERKLDLKKRRPVYVDKGLSLGLALNYPIAVNGQKNNGLDMNGHHNKWQDYLPAVYAQLHLNKKVYLQAEWQPVAAQYTPNYTLYHNIDEPNPDEKEEKIIKLNKLFYTSLPVSVHYKTPLKNVSVGVGLQYSLLKKIILQDQEYYHLIGPGTWDTTERKNEVAVKSPNTVREHNSGDVADNVARAFRREDWRLLADVGYQYKGLSAGLRYTRGLHYYYNSTVTNLPVKARNESFQVYLRMNLFDTRKK